MDERINESRVASFCLFSLILLISGLDAVGYDTGWIQWKQPNGVTFTGRSWGDEFQGWKETSDGYRFVKNWGDVYYYYAILDASGEFAPSTEKVGIDPPLAGSFKLERSAIRQAEIDAQIAAFEQEVEQNALEFAQRQSQAKAAGQPVVYNVGVILVEFSDTLHYQSTDSTRPNGYWISDFENMLFGSPGDWYAPEDTSNSPHPEGEQLFGSMRDYYWQQSFPNGPVGALEVLGHVVNLPVDPLALNPVPLWIQLDHGKLWYSQNVGHISEAVQKAKDLGLIPQNPYKPVGPYDHLVIIYAGDTVFGGILNPSYSSKKHDMGERLYMWGNRYFSHIGIHCHEFGHRLGFPDDSGGGYFGLMATKGAMNGPGSRSACPSALEPNNRISAGWITPQTIVENQQNFTVSYDYLSPKFYIIESQISDEYFLFENRGRDGFDRYTPFNDGFSDQGGALLIWENASVVIKADNNAEDTQSSWLADFFPTYGLSSQDFNDLTEPSSNLSNGAYSYIALNNITWNQVDTITTIGLISRNYDPAPAAPVLSISGSIGDNPTLSWVDGGELDLDHFILKKTYTNIGGTMTWYINIPAGTNEYTDTGIMIQKRGLTIAKYRVKSVDWIDQESAYSNQRSTSGLGPMWKEALPLYFTLHGNFPNPFNPTTTIRYDLPEASYVSLMIYDILGREVRTLLDSRVDAGFKSVVWDGRDDTGNSVSTGIYIYMLRVWSLESAKTYHKTEKMVLLR